MKRIMLKNIVLCLLSMTLLLGCTSFVFGAEEFYWGISKVSNSINTEVDFYGNIYDDEVIYVPKLDDGNGYSITWGMEFSRFALELGFTASSHNGYYPGDNLDTTYNIFDVNFKRFIGSSKHFRPYWLAGLCITSLTVEDGAFYYDDYYNDYYYDDVTYTGAGLNVGYGLELKILHAMALKGEIIYRLVSFSSADGVYTSGTLDEPFDGSGLCFNAGLNFYF